MRIYRHAAAAVVIVLIAAFAAYAEEPAKRSPGEYIDDKAITAKVKAALLKDPEVKALQVNVDTYNGVVQLSGFVDNEKQISQAAKVAGSVEGVKSVKNDLVVRAKPAR
jgi:osmotically-inducible protein OsmY